MKMYANKTGINIIISDQPIQWSDKSVNLVIMMCFNKNERYMFNEIYELITMILSESENVKKSLLQKIMMNLFKTLSIYYKSSSELFLSLKKTCLNDMSDLIIR